MLKRMAHAALWRHRNDPSRTHSGGQNDTDDLDYRSRDRGWRHLAVPGVEMTVQDDDAEFVRQLDGQFTLETRQRLERIASRLSPTPDTDQQGGAPLRDRAGRPSDQAPAGLGDTATIPSAGEE